MSQPHLPAPLAQRPDPGDQLLEAVRLRQASRSLQLAQHWVHRRGVTDLQRFCSMRLSSSEGPEAVAWLQDLLALNASPAAVGEQPACLQQQAEPQKPIAHPPSAVPSAEAPAVTVAAGDGADPMADKPATGSPATWTPVLLEGGSARPLDPTLAPSTELSLADSEQLERELQARAVAAVDEAFAALAQTFEETVGAPTAAAPPAPAAPLSFRIEASAGAGPATSSSAPPEPPPVRMGLWPSLKASAASLGAALRPSGGSVRRGPGMLDQQPTTADLEQPGGSAVTTTPTEPASLAAEATATLPLEAPGATPPVAADPLVAAELAPLEAQLMPPLPQEAPAAVPAVSEAEASGEDGIVREDDQGQEPAELARDPAADLAVRASSEADPAKPAGKRSRLLQRLRGRLPKLRLPRLSRLRAVMRECFEETVALLRMPEPEFQDDEDFDSEEPEVQPVQEQPSPSWTIETFLPPSPEPTASPLGNPAAAAAAEPLPSPDTATQAPAAVPAAVSAAVAAPPAAVPPLRPSPTVSKPSPRGDRPPAPAPAALSDLRAWLPDRNDLPRAS